MTWRCNFAFWRYNFHILRLPSSLEVTEIVFPGSNGSSSEHARALVRVELRLTVDCLISKIPTIRQSLAHCSSLIESGDAAALSGKISGGNYICSENLGTTVGSKNGCLRIVHVITSKSFTCRFTHELKFY